MARQLIQIRKDVLEGGTPELEAFMARTAGPVQAAIREEIHELNDQAELDSAIAMMGGGSISSESTQHHGAAAEEPGAEEGPGEEPVQQTGPDADGWETVGRRRRGRR